MLRFIGFVIQIAGYLILGCVLLLSKWNLITRYPVIFNFRVGTGRVLEKKFGTGRVPGSRRTLIVAGIFSDDFENWPLQFPCILCRRLWKVNSKFIVAAKGNVLSSDYDLSKTFRPRCFWQICTVFPCVCKFSKMSASQPSAFSIGQLLLEIAV